MALTPVEIRHVQLGRGFRGYKRARGRPLLDEIAESFEDVWRERADLADKVEQLERELVAAQGARGAAPHDARVRRARGAGAARAGRARRPR